VGFRLELLGAVATRESETWEAFWEGGPRKSDGGGSRSNFARVFGDCDILTCCRTIVAIHTSSGGGAVSSLALKLISAK
jgi:hypothetical protein